MDNETEATRRSLVIEGPVTLGYDKKGLPTLSGAVKKWGDAEIELLNEWFEHVKDERSALQVPGFRYVRRMNGLDECPGYAGCDKCKDCGDPADNHGTEDVALAADPDFCEVYAECTTCDYCGKEHE